MPGGSDCALARGVARCVAPSRPVASVPVLALEGGEDQGAHVVDVALDAHQSVVIDLAIFVAALLDARAFLGEFLVQPGEQRLVGEGFARHGGGQPGGEGDHDADGRRETMVAKRLQDLLGEGMAGAHVPGSMSVAPGGSAALGPGRASGSGRCSLVGVPPSTARGPADGLLSCSCDLLLARLKLTLVQHMRYTMKQMLKRDKRRLALGIALSALIAPAANAEALVLYTNDFEDIIGDRFTADTGFEIEVVQESGGNLLARIAAERGNPQWDVLLFDGIGSLHRLDQEGQLRRDFTPGSLENLTDFARGLLPENHAWFPAGAQASCVLAYRTDLVETPPQSYGDLLDPAYRGRIGQADPAVAAPAYPCVATTFHAWGEDPARAFWSGLLDNDLRVFRTNGPTRRAMESGEIEIALISSPNAYRMMRDDTPVEVIWPYGAAPASSRGVAIQAETERMDAAEAFVTWMLLPETQQFLTDEGGNDGAFLASVEGVTPMEGGPAADRAYHIAPAAFAAEMEAPIKNWFADQAIR